MREITELIQRNPALRNCEAEIARAAELLLQTYERGGKLLLCGNGGSCADAEHISGELLKGFLKKRPLREEQKAALRARCPQLEERELEQLQQGLPAIPLASLTAVQTAFANDVDASLAFAQGVLALGKPGDAFWGISTSGNSANVAAAARVAKGMGLTVLGLTGESGGILRELSDVCIRVPERETYRVQELHLPVYHAICAAVEAHFFSR